MGSIRRMSVLAVWSLLLVAIVPLSPPQAGATGPPIVEYLFNGTFVDARGGSSITVHPDCVGDGPDPCNSPSSAFGSDAAGGYWAWQSTNARGGGFTVDLDRDLGHTYSVGVRFSFAELSSWRKIIDYKDRVSDDGFYLYHSQIQFYPHEAAGETYAPDEMLDLVAVRAGSPGSDAGTFTVYAIGSDGDVTKVYEIEDVDGESIPSVVGGTSRLGFFFDDLYTSAEATSGGKVWGVRIWDRALAANEIGTALDKSTADLRTTKTVSAATAEIGDLVTYTVTVDNAGPDTATGVTVTDKLPSQVVFSSATQGCTHAAGTVTCTRPTLASGGSWTLQIVAAVTAAGTVVNSATASSAATDPQPGNNTDAATFTATRRDEPVERIAGLTRIETAVKASETTFADQGAEAVVVARSDGFPDALAGGALAVANNGPLLLNPTGSLHPDVLAEIRRILPAGGPVFLLGGTSALSDEIRRQVTAAGFMPDRVAGADRYATAVAIAERLDPEVVFLATGRNFPDALAAGAAAAEVHGALLLTQDRVMHAATESFLAEHDDLARYAAGGQAAAADPSAKPLAGPDRYATALLVAKEFFPKPVIVGIATGTGFADALAGVAHIGRRHGPMLLSTPTALPRDVQTYLEERRATIEAAFLYGGSGALSADVESAVASAIG